MAEKKVNSKKYFVSDPEKADRSFDVDDEKIVLEANGGAVEVSKKQADFLKENFSYLVVEAK